MSYNSNTPREEFTATSGQTVFSFLFKIYEDTDIKAYLTPVGNTPDDVADLLTLTTDYTVVINGDAGGTLTLNSGATTGDAVTLVRELEITRDTEYQTSGDLLAATLNADQEYQTYLVADQEALATRYLVIPQNAQGIDNTLPNPVSESYLRWNTAATALENDTTLPTAVSDAAASAAAALVSETNAAASEASASSNASSTAADVVSTNADVVSTNADVVLTNADVVSSAANALAAQVAEISWTTGGWQTATAYTASEPRQALEHNGASYICILNHTSGATTEPLIGASWATYWEVLAERGNDGTGDMSDLVDDLTPQLGGDLDANSNDILMGDNEIIRAKMKDIAFTLSAIGNTGATQTFDLEVANAFTATLDQACTFTFSNPPATGIYGVFKLFLTNGGAFAITWPTSVDWDSATAPTLTASGLDILKFETYDAGTTWLGTVEALGMA